MPLKGLTRAEAVWLRRKARALGSLEAALRAIVATGRSVEHTARRVAPLVATRQQPTMTAHLAQPTPPKGTQA